MGSWKGLKASKLPTTPARSTVHLDQWAGIDFAFGEEVVTFTSREIFNALKEVP